MIMNNNVKIQHVVHIQYRCNKKINNLMEFKLVKKCMVICWFYMMVYFLLL